MALSRAEFYDRDARLQRECDSGWNDTGHFKSREIGIGGRRR